MKFYLHTFAAAVNKSSYSHLWISVCTERMASRARIYSVLETYVVYILCISFVDAWVLCFDINTHPQTSWLPHLTAYILTFLFLNPEYEDVKHKKTASPAAINNTSPQHIKSKPSDKQRPSQLCCTWRPCSEENRTGCHHLFSNESWLHYQKPGIWAWPC